MKIPIRLQPLIDALLIDDVLGQLQSGKEAEVYVVLAEGMVRCAKVYKEANNRSFKHRVQYTEGRKTRDSRKSRAMNSRSRFGRKEAESEWHNTEVDALTMLANSGVRVPKIHGYYEGVLLLEMIVDEDGNPAPRLNDVPLTAEQARRYHRQLLQQVIVMLCAGFVHGDLSEFNVLVSHDGLTIIDLPQAVQATSNTAFGILERDLTQLAAFFGRFAPELRQAIYAKEIWKYYKSGSLKLDTELTGEVETSSGEVDLNEVLDEIEEAREEEMRRRGFKS